MTQPKINLSALDTATVGDAKATISAYLFGQNTSTTTGLTLGYYGGVMVVDGVLTTITNGTVGPLTASTTNYIEATRAGVVSFNTTGFTIGRIPLFTIVTGVSTITSVVDTRATSTFEGVDSRLSISVAGNSDVTLTAAQGRVDILHLTGVLTGNINVIVSDGPQKFVVFNVTTGNFTLTVKTAAGTGIVIPRIKPIYLYSDGTNVVDVSVIFPTSLMEIIVDIGDETTAITTGTAKKTFRIPRAMTLTEVRASLTVAQATGTIFTVDVNEGVSSIFSTPITIDNTTTTSVGATTPAVISDTSLADNAVMTVDVDQIGDGTAAGLKVQLIGYRT